MSTRKAHVSAFALAVSLAAASFSASAAEAYSVSLHLFHKGKEFGAPSMVVKSGVAGTMEVTGPNGYKLKVTASDDGPNRIKVSTQLESSHGSMSPEVVVRPGTQATIAVGDLKVALTATPHGS